MSNQWYESNLIFIWVKWSLDQYYLPSAFGFRLRQLSQIHQPNSAPSSFPEKIFQVPLDETVRMVENVNRRMDDLQMDHFINKKQVTSDPKGIGFFVC